MARSVTDGVCLRFNNSATGSTSTMIANQEFANKELRQLDCIVRELRPTHSADAANVRQSLDVCRVFGRRGSLVALVLRHRHVLRNPMTEARSFASADPENGMWLPGTTFWGSAMKASSVCSSQVNPAPFIAQL